VGSCEVLKCLSWVILCACLCLCVAGRGTRTILYTQTHADAPVTSLVDRVIEFQSEWDLQGTSELLDKLPAAGASCSSRRLAPGNIMKTLPTLDSPHQRVLSPLSSSATSGARGRKVEEDTHDDKNKMGFSRREARYVQVPETRGGEEQEQEQQETSGGHGGPTPVSWVLNRGPRSSTEVPGPNRNT